MKLCPTCQRHLRSPEARCPFCGAEQRSGAAGLAVGVLLGVMLAACSEKPLETGSSDGSGASMGGSTTSGGSGGSSSTGPTTAAPTSASSTDPDGTTTPTTNGSNSDTVDDAGDEGCAFYAGCPADVGPSPLECDTFAQDCPDGQKCAPWADKGSIIENATRCVPVGDREVGESCEAPGGGLAGQDDCVAGAVCWELDDQGAGHCVAMCGGTQSDPTCGADETCVPFGDVLAICAPLCDPLVQGCPDDDVCVAEGTDFVCVVDVSGDTGAFNDPCKFDNSCDPGLSCLPKADVSASCPDQNRCCTPFCEFPGGACPNPDQVCVQWFEGKDLKPENEKIGFCGLMQ